MTPWKGIYPPAVTPLLPDGRLDVAGLERLTEHLIQGGVHGIFLLGTTGEGPSLSVAMKREVVTRACRCVRGRVRMLVAITDTSFTESIALAQFAAEQGADALVIAPPHYIPPGQDELLEYLTHMVPELPLPLFLYNMPAMTKVHFALETVRRAADLPGIIGMKDSSCNMIYYHELINMFHERSFAFFMGPEELLGESVLYGGSGGVPGGANIAPALYVEMYDAAHKKDVPTMLLLQKYIFKLREIYQIGRFASGGIKGIKCALSLMGIADDHMAEPFHHFQEPERKKVQMILETLKIKIGGR